MSCDTTDLRTVKRGDKLKMIEGCGKREYSSRAKARKAMTQKHAGLPGRQEPYQCPFCGFWHTTTA